MSAQLETTYWHYYRPTNGAFTLFLALQTCDVVRAAASPSGLALFRANPSMVPFFVSTNIFFSLFQVDAYGFITANHSQYPNYYFEKIRSSVVFYINHDYNLEIKLWEKLHDAKIIRLYKRTEKRQ